LDDTIKAQRSPEQADRLGPMPTLRLSSIEESGLRALIAQRSAEVRLVERARLVLGAAAGHSDLALSRQFRCGRETARRWRLQYAARRAKAPDAPLGVRLADASRVGRPAELPDALWVDLLSLTTTLPSQHGVPFTHWTSEALAALAVEKGWAKHLSSSYVRAFLASSRLKPHLVKEWMNRPDDPQFDARATHIKDVLAGAQEAQAAGSVVLSFDEKTGMQAKERLSPSQPMKSGQPERQEFEYKRHGTLVLFTFFLVASGAVSCDFGETRTNVDTAEVLTKQVEATLAAGAKRVDVVLDQLNTHMSLPMVLAMAKVCGLSAPGEEMLGHRKARRAWLELPGKAVVFHFTPKHASWLNPVEIWFGVLVRKVLRRGSFCSKADLQQKVEAFVSYFNEKLAHPYHLRRYQWAA
jgi:hypothetical protein